MWTLLALEVAVTGGGETGEESADKQTKLPGWLRAVHPIDCRRLSQYFPLALYPPSPRGRGSPQNPLAFINSPSPLTYSVYHNPWSIINIGLYKLMDREYLLCKCPSHMRHRPALSVRCFVVLAIHFHVYANSNLSGIIDF